MKQPILALALIAISTAHLRADLISDPAAKAAGVVDAPTYKLYQSLTGSQWGYVWHDTTAEVAFGQGGSITTSPWPGATWRITGANSIAIKHPKAGEISIHFNPEFTKWTCKDWSGDHAVGIRRNPNATQAK